MERGAFRIVVSLVLDKQNRLLNVQMGEIWREGLVMMN